MRMQEHKFLLKYQDLFNNMPIPYIRCKIIDNNDSIDMQVLDVNKAFNDNIISRKEIQYKNRAEIEKTKIGSLDKYFGVSKEVLNKRETHISDFIIDKYIYTSIVMPAEEPYVIYIFFIDAT